MVRRVARLRALRLRAAGANVSEHTGFGDGGFGSDVCVRDAGLRERADRKTDDGGEEHTFFSTLEDTLGSGMGWSLSPTSMIGNDEY